MIRHLKIVAIVTWIGMSPAFAGQEKLAAQDRSTAAERTNPVQVQVVISRYRDDKKIASMPYLLSVPVNQGEGRLQVGGQVPIPGGNGPQAGVQYRNVGTSITVTVKSAGDDGYVVFTNVSESAVAGDGQPGLKLFSGEAPVLKTYTSSSALVLKQGQTAQFTAATDPITGETVRVDVTLNPQK